VNNFVFKLAVNFFQSFLRLQKGNQDKKSCGYYQYQPPPSFNYHSDLHEIKLAFGIAGIQKTTASKTLQF
jgi:hypothetical protein